MSTARKLILPEGNPIEQQIELLKCMSHADEQQSNPMERQYLISDLARVVGSDEKEVQRSLYILEGHKFVTPFPEGDFTSKSWKITEIGVKALQHLNTEASHLL